MVLPYLHSKYVKTKEEVETCTDFMQCIFLFFLKSKLIDYFPPKAIVQFRCTVLYSPYLFSTIPTITVGGQIYKNYQITELLKVNADSTVSLLF